MKRKITQLVADGFYKQALLQYAHHHAASLHPGTHTFPPLLKASAKLNLISTGQSLHTRLIKTGFFSNIHASTALTSMYMNFGFIDDALKVSDEIPDRKLQSFNAVISGLSQNGCFAEAFWVFREVGVLGLRPEAVTIASLLGACESVGLGAQVHCWGVKLGVVEVDMFVGSSLLGVYFRDWDVVSAEKVFGAMQYKNLVSYNAYMTGLLQCRMFLVVLNVFKDMMECLDEKPDSIMVVSVLSACGRVSYLRFGRQVHGFAVKVKMEDSDMVGTGLIDMYSNCGLWLSAYSVFKEMNRKGNLAMWNCLISGMMLNGQSEIAVELFEFLGCEGLSPDLVTWNSMISGFSQLRKGFEAFKYFKKMQLANEVPRLKTVTSLLPACSVLCALKQGKEVHGYAVRNCMVSDEFLAVALIDMYMKCGQPSKAKRVFDQFEMKPRDPAFWNAMISGYGRNGEYESAFEIFELMQQEKALPNSATFVCLLSACSHSGSVEKVWRVFKMMISDYGVNPSPDHYGCMVDLLGRSGKLQEARDIIYEMEKENPSVSVIHSLLGACRSHGDTELGEEMAMKLVELEPQNPAPLVVLSNMYAQQHRWFDVERIRELMDNRQLRKYPGYSSAHVN